MGDAVFNVKTPGISSTGNPLKEGSKENKKGEEIHSALLASSILAGLFESKSSSGCEAGKVVKV